MSFVHHVSKCPHYCTLYNNDSPGNFDRQTGWPTRMNFFTCNFVMYFEEKNDKRARDDKTTDNVYNASRALFEGCLDFEFCWLLMMGRNAAQRRYCGGGKGWRFLYKNCLVWLRVFQGGEDLGQGVTVSPEDVPVRKFLIIWKFSSNNTYFPTRNNSLLQNSSFAIN